MSYHELVESIDLPHSKHTHCLGLFPTPLLVDGLQLCAEEANLDCPPPGMQTGTSVGLGGLIYHLESIKPYNLRSTRGMYDLLHSISFMSESSDS